MKKIIVSIATALAIMVGSFGTVAATTTTSLAESRVVVRYDTGNHKGHYRNGGHYRGKSHYRGKNHYRDNRRHQRICRVVVTKKVVWRNHQRHIVRVKQRRCH